MSTIEKESSDVVPKHLIVERQLADAQRELLSTKSALAAAEGTVKVLQTDRDGYKARAEKAEQAVVENEVEALVGVKIAPAEKADFIDLAKTNRPLFERMVASRPEMKLLGGQVIAAEASSPPSISPTSKINGAALANKIFGA